MIETVSPQYLDAEFKKRGPWATRFIIDGKAYGGEYCVATDARIQQFCEAFPGARTILDLGTLEGGHAIALAKRIPGAHIVAIDGRPAHIERARFIKDVTGAENVRFICDNLEEVSFAPLGRFDAILCIGLLYHLPKPWELLEKLSLVSSQLFLWTYYARESDANLSRHGYRGLDYEESEPDHPFSGLSSTSFWPTLDSLHEMLEAARFSSIRILKHDSLPPGLAVTLTATQTN